MKLKEIMIMSAILIVALVVIVSARNIADGTTYGSYSFSGINTVSNTNNNQNANLEVPTVQNGVQKVALSLVNGRYQLSPPNLKKDVPVRMEVDLSSVTGCMTSVTIPGFNVRKYVSPGDNIITFTPDKTGTFQIACSMGMGRNTFNVVDETGNVGTYVESAKTAGGSCGAGGGGCGCGGGAKL